MHCLLPTSCTTLPFTKHNFDTSRLSVQCVAEARSMMADDIILCWLSLRCRTFAVAAPNGQKGMPGLFRPWMAAPQQRPASHTLLMAKFCVATPPWQRSQQRLRKLSLDGASLARCWCEALR